MNNECYSIKELMQKLKISRQTVTNWRKAGKLKVTKINRKVLIQKSEVERLLKENEE